MIRLIKKYKYLLGILIVSIIVFGSIAIRIKLGEEDVFYEQENIILDDTKDKNDSQDKEVIKTDDKIFVDVKGAVLSPGVYEIDKGKRVIDVVNMAGGLREEADTSLINMAKIVEDSMVIIIYTESEVRDINGSNGEGSKVIDNTCVCPGIKNDGCLNNNVNDNSSEIKGKVNINAANIEELQTLPGIGEEKAKNIISYREANGLFSSIEDIVNVSGIGESIYEKIKEYITV